MAAWGFFVCARTCVCVCKYGQMRLIKMATVLITYKRNNRQLTKQYKHLLIRSRSTFFSGYCTFFFTMIKEMLFSKMWTIIFVKTKNEKSIGRFCF